MDKVYAVMIGDVPEEIFLDKISAHRFAEDKYGSRSDGICVDGVSVKAFYLNPVIKDG